MDETVSTQPELKTTADYKATFARLLDQITRVEEKMLNDRAAIERLQVETQILKAESDIIKAHSQVRLDALMAV